MKKMIHAWRELARDESGAAAVEYGLLAGLIAVIIVGSVTAVGQSVKTVFDNIAAAI